MVLGYSRFVSKVALIAMLAGCGFSHGKATSDGAGPGSDTGGSGSDAKVFLDGSGSAQTDARACFGAAGYSVCLDGSQLPTGPVTLPGSLATDGAMCQPTQPTDWTTAGQPDACFIVGTMITSAGGKTVVTGPRPLVLLATDTISLTKDLDVASHQAGGDGPGANPSVCGSYVTNPDTDGNGGGGGAGGSFITIGGTGAPGDNGAARAGSGLPGVSAPATLRGGCPGQKGGGGSSSTNGGTGASGGGALYLVAGTAITLDMLSIDASGAGSTHGGHASGGGGGGSGGMIVLWAPQFTLTSVNLVANGGGASSGGDSDMAGHNGNDGNDPDPAMPTMAAGGGNGPGGNGGSGSVSGGTGSSGDPGSSNNGGGGGGGGAGYIQANKTLSATASPAVTVAP